MVEVINNKQSVPIDFVPSILDKDASIRLVEHNFRRFDNSPGEDLD